MDGRTDGRTGGGRTHLQEPVAAAAAGARRRRRQVRPPSVSCQRALPEERSEIIWQIRRGNLAVKVLLKHSFGRSGGCLELLCVLRVFLPLTLSAPSASAMREGKEGCARMCCVFGNFTAAVFGQVLTS